MDQRGSEPDARDSSHDATSPIGDEGRQDDQAGVPVPSAPMPAAISEDYIPTEGPVAKIEPYREPSLGGILRALRYLRGTDPPDDETQPERRGRRGS
jgi:hypothetical protein